MTATSRPGAKERGTTQALFCPSLDEAQLCCIDPVGTSQLTATHSLFLAFWTSCQRALNG